MKNFGFRLKRLREKGGLTIDQLAVIGICNACMVRDWENNSRVLTVGSIIRLAKYFGVSTDYLLGL